MDSCEATKPLLDGLLRQLQPGAFIDVNDNLLSIIRLENSKLYGASLLNASIQPAGETALDRKLRKLPLLILKSLKVNPYRIIALGKYFLADRG